MRKVRCITSYRSSSARYEPGQEFEASEAEVAHLMVDAPGCFELVSEQAVARDVVTPPVSKKVSSPKRRGN